jgi:hypothetical protein
LLPQLAQVAGLDEAAFAERFRPAIDGDVLEAE